MPWVKFADDYLTNGKVKELDAYARLLDLCSILYSARELRDGEMSVTDVQTVATLAHVRHWKTAADQLVRVGRWLRNADGSYSIHDYLLYQPTREQVLAQRAADRQRKRAGVTKRWSESGRNPDSPGPGPGPAGPGASYVEAPSRARAPNAAPQRRAPTAPGEPAALRAEQQQCPLCPEVFPNNAALRDHVDNSPRHKVRPEPETFGRKRDLAPEVTEQPVTTELPADLLAEHERYQARERALNSHD
jgi:hypothetical protein